MGDRYVDLKKPAMSVQLSIPKCTEVLKIKFRHGFNVYDGRCIIAQALLDVRCQCVDDSFLCNSTWCLNSIYKSSLTGINLNSVVLICMLFVLFNNSSYNMTYIDLHFKVLRLIPSAVKKLIQFKQKFWNTKNFIVLILQKKNW